MDQSNNSIESWRPVAGYEGLYTVSDRGRVWGVKRHHFIKLYVTKPRGYIGVVLYRFGVRKAAFVHTLVSRAFIGPLPEGKEVNHQDGHKTNNRPNNLEYVTPSENAKHAWMLGLWSSHSLKGEDCNFAKLTEKQVVEIRKKSKQGFSMNQLAKMYGVSRKAIQRIRTGKTWAHSKQ